MSPAREADQDRGQCPDSMGPRKGEQVEGRGNAARGVEKGVGGDCEGAAAKCSGHHNGKRFVKLSYSGFRLCSWVRNYPVGRKEKRPLEEVKNLFEPMTRTAQVTPIQQHGRRKLDSQAISKSTPSMCHAASVETPTSRPIPMDYMPSAMKGVVLTSMGEILATPTPAELVKLFKCSPKVGLNFGKILDFEEGDSGEKAGQDQHEDDSASPPPSPSLRKERAKDKNKDQGDALSGNSTSSSDTSAANTSKQPNAVAVPPPTRIRRPSIRSSHRALRCQPATLTTPTSDPAGFNDIDDNGTAVAVARSRPIPVPKSHPSPEYDFADEENLPSPFLKRVDKAAAAAAPSSIPSNGVETSGPGSSSKGL